jgi:hypothetical protein
MSRPTHLGRTRRCRIVIARFAALLLAGPVIAACTFTDTAIVIGGATLVSFIHTDKTVSDHVIGAITERDCSTMRMVAEGAPMCRELGESRLQQARATAQAQMAASQSHCYRELGRVSCYDRPNPYSYRTGDNATAQRR